MVRIANDRANGVKLATYLVEGDVTVQSNLYRARGEAMDTFYTFESPISNGDFVRLEKTGVGDVPVAVPAAGITTDWPAAADGDIIGIVITQPEMPTITANYNPGTEATPLLDGTKLRRATVLWMSFSGTKVGTCAGAYTPGTAVHLVGTTWTSGGSAPVGVVLTKPDGSNEAVILY